MSSAGWRRLALTALAFSAINNGVSPLPVSPTPSTTPTPTLSATPSPSFLPLFCASCTIYKYEVYDNYQFWEVPADADYSYLGVALWGAGGWWSSGFLNRERTRGAFVMGALPVVRGELLRIIVGSARRTSADYHGCGASATLPQDTSSRGKGGGRSAIQRRLTQLPDSVFTDLAVSGGGGTAIGSSTVSFIGPECVSDGGALRVASGPSTIAGASDANYQSCTNGVLGCGTGAGGGGFCGGMNTSTSNLICGGGGSSLPSNLVCPVVADSQFGNLTSGVLLPSTGTLGTGGSDGAVWIWILPPTWEPCMPGFRLDPSVSPTPSPSLSPTSSPTPSTTASESRTPSTSPSHTSSHTPTPSLSPTPSPTPSTTASESRTPSTSPSPSVSPTPTSTLSASQTPSPSLSPTSSPTPTSTLSASQTPSPSPWPFLQIGIGMGRNNLTALGSPEAVEALRGALAGVSSSSTTGGSSSVVVVAPPLLVRVVSVCGVAPRVCSYRGGGRRLLLLESSHGRALSGDSLTDVLVEAELLFADAQSLEGALSSMSNDPQAWKSRLAAALANSTVAVLGSVSLTAFTVLASSTGKRGASSDAGEGNGLFATVPVALWMLVVAAVLVALSCVVVGTLCYCCARRGGGKGGAQVGPSTTTTTTVLSSAPPPPGYGGWVQGVPPSGRGDGQGGMVAQLPVSFAPAQVQNKGGGGPGGAAGAAAGGAAAAPPRWYLAQSRRLGEGEGGGGALM